MKTFAALFAAAAVAAAMPSAAAENAGEWAEYDFERNYAAAQASGISGRGGSHMHDSFGPSARIGRYFGDFLAWEAAVQAADGRAGLGVRGLWHWWGYEKFDPFFTFGAEGWFGGGDAGPCAGWGAFWHFDDNWSFRFDASFMLGVADGATAAFSIAAGFQYSW